MQAVYKAQISNTFYSEQQSLQTHVLVLLLTTYHVI